MDNQENKQDNIHFNKNEFIKSLKNDFVSTIRKVYINSLQKEVGFREVTVKEQKQLSRIMIDNEKRQDIIYDAQCALINQLCLDDTFDIYNVSEFDKIKLLLVIYQMNMFKSNITFKCKQCGSENQYKLNFSNVVKKLDKFDISEKEFSYENDTWMFNFTIYYPNVKKVSDFYRYIVKKYLNNSKIDNSLASEDMINVDYINLFVKKIHMKNKTNNIEKDILLTEFEPYEIDEIFSVFPQDVMYNDAGIIKYISKNFIENINDTFDKHKCAVCGTISSENIDNTVENFF